jgi:hypothetical protein
MNLIMNYRHLSIVFLLTLVGCTNQEATDAKVTAIEKKLTDILEAQEKRISELETKLLIQSFEIDANKSVILKPSSTGYSVIKSDLGFLTVQIVDASQFANSTRVKLKFGNPLGTSINGLKGTYEWGTVNDKGYIKDVLGTTEISLNETIFAGSWTNATITLEGLDVKTLGYLKLSNLSHTGIMLNRR